MIAAAVPHKDLLFDKTGGFLFEINELPMNVSSVKVTSAEWVAKKLQSSCPFHIKKNSVAYFTSALFPPGSSSRSSEHSQGSIALQ